MDKEVQGQFQVTLVRDPNMTDDEVRRRCKRAFDVILGFDSYRVPHTLSGKKAKSKPADIIRVSDDLGIELTDDRLVLRRGEAAVRINPGEVRALQDGLMDAAARLVGRQHQVCRGAEETPAPESTETGDAKSSTSACFFSSVRDWLNKIQMMSNEELEIIKHEAVVDFTAQEREAFATAYSLFREFG